MLAIASEVSFQDRGRAAANLVRLAGELPAGVQERVRILLRASADPDGALHHLIRLSAEQPAAFQRLLRSGLALQALTTVFSYSRFLSEELLKAPEWIEALPRPGDLHRVISAAEYASRLDAGRDFASFRRQQLVRILLRDLMGYASLSEITEELSNLADGILDNAYRRIHDGRMGLSIIALGKLGARELNYSSDIDLMFVYEGSGNLEFFKKTCVRLTDALSEYTAHGMCYRVDLRLRPYGSMGEVCLSLDGAKAYYEKRARDWELQMLIKARVAAGDQGPGRELLDFVEPLTYSSSLDFSKVEAVSESRMRISERLNRKRGSNNQLDIKLAPGGIRDIEFLVQCLQRLHGGREPWVRHAGTLLALSRLRDKNLLSEIEYGRLAPAYLFLRNLEHRLQFLDDRQTHSLPSDEDELELLARRMPPSQLGSSQTAAHLMEELERHFEAVKEIYERVVRARLPAQEPVARATLVKETEMAAPLEADPVPANLKRILAQKAPGLAMTLGRSQLRNGARAFEHFLERVLPSAEYRGWLDQDAKLAGYAIDIFEHSPYFAEQLNRKPELIAELREMRLEPGALHDYGAMAGLFDDPADLRRYFNREMLRIQCESICLRTPIFETLKRTSDLADCAVAAAFGMALNDAPKDRMTVVALGRLGMQEFDLASDADLVFVLADADAGEMEFWTRVAERLMQLLTAYTGDGTLFAVDTRLRPNGGAGPLVQTEGGFKDYFTKGAQAWEGITYMKARAVAGNLEHGTRFLNELQELDWRRYGQGGRSKANLKQMRERLEKEQGGENPLKAGPGGYYDIDFALMYLRLKSAGIFYPVLNTPARVDVIEKMGHLERADARFLLDAATFYRSVDHALRLSTGHAEGNLPNAQLQLEMIAELAARWTPEHLHDQPLPDELRQIQSRTREFFERLFG